MNENQSEFIFDDFLEEGFTVVPNAILNDPRINYLTLGVYVTILKYRNLKGWKIYQSTLVTEHDKKTKVRNAVKDLIECGYMEKITLRDEKGRMNGVKYKVYSRPNTDIQKSENPTTVKQTQIDITQPKSVCRMSVEQTLQNKDIYKIKTEQNKEEKINKEKYKKEKPKSKSKKQSIDEMINEYTSNEELINTIYDFIEMRKTIKKPVTERALKIAINKLEEYAKGNDALKIAMIEKSITNCWTGIFELKEYNKGYNNKPYGSRYSTNKPTPAEMEELRIKEYNKDKEAYNKRRAEEDAYYLAHKEELEAENASIDF